MNILSITDKELSIKIFEFIDADDPFSIDVPRSFKHYKRIKDSVDFYWSGLKTRSTAQNMLDLFFIRGFVAGILSCLAEYELKIDED